MRERAGDSRIRLWVLLTANRSLLAGILTSGLFLALVVAGALNVTPLRSVIREGTHVERLFQSFIMSLVTGITLVVTLNQLVLSQELGPLGDQRNRMSGAVEFRQDIEDAIDAIAPPEPASFMQAFMALSRERAERLREVTEDNSNSDLRDSVDAFTDRIRAHADEIDAQLSDAQFGRFEVVGAILNYNYSWKIYRLRRIHSEYTDSLSEDERAAFDDLTELLQLFGPAREHIKTLYFRWELVNFSRGMLYTGVPALAISIMALLYVDPNSFAGSTLGVDNVILVVSAAAAIALTPFFLLVAYILRLGTIAQRTLAIGPFILRESQRTEEIEFGDTQ